MTSERNEPSGVPPPEAEVAAVDLARRRLLRIAVYAPPAILGSLALSRSAKAQAPSCGPAACAPSGCVPGPGCSPSTCGPFR